MFKDLTIDTQATVLKIKEQEDYLSIMEIIYTYTCTNASEIL